ncbi:hypothetical protein OnM2_104016 [Erysiphe neolycopersici]|uniref:Uncharacterized protein n=1 Tax=Erysiphe neolycopersici TaxID=212602 RepID=A0A420H7Z0_9PEZI|nr:hypothetical protein OnM2_104016 [Erysiphe neolycopersici]
MGLPCKYKIWLKRQGQMEIKIKDKHPYWHITRLLPNVNWEDIGVVHLLSPNWRNNRADQRKTQRKKAKASSNNGWTSTLIPSQFERNVSNYVPSPISPNITINGQAAYAKLNWLDIDQQYEKEGPQYCVSEAHTGAQHFQSNLFEYLISSCFHESRVNPQLPQLVENSYQTP